MKMPISFSIFSRASRFSSRWALRTSPKCDICSTYFLSQRLLAARAGITLRGHDQLLDSFSRDRRSELGRYADLDAVRFDDRPVPVLRAAHTGVAAKRQFRQRPSMYHLLEFALSTISKRSEKHSFQRLLPAWLASATPSMVIRRRETPRAVPNCPCMGIGWGCRRRTRSRRCILHGLKHRQMANPPKLHNVVGERQLVVSFEGGDFVDHDIANSQSFHYLSLQGSHGSRNC